MDSSKAVKKAIGLAVKLRRIQAGLKQDELAFRCGMARSYLSGIERGVVSASLNSVWRLANALDCKVSALIVDVECVLDDQRKTN